MARESVMSTPIFDQLLREMAQRAEPRAPTPQKEPVPEQSQEQARSNAARRRHRAD
jgi:hypothetical protein